jgi:serine/threonine-protein kinase
VIGKTLGHYEILEPLGAGGMGAVFRARDTNLRRDVAIKVLPEALANDEDKLARLRREAQLLASVNHPNIAAIYNLEESAGTRWLVLELVEGTTLEQELRTGPLTVAESLRIGVQIAAALEAAHEKGIVHRD